MSKKGDHSSKAVRTLAGAVVLFFGGIVFASAGTALLLERILLGSVGGLLFVGTGAAYAVALLLLTAAVVSNKNLTETRR